MWMANVEGRILRSVQSVLNRQIQDMRENRDARPNQGVGVDFGEQAGEPCVGISQTEVGPIAPFQLEPATVQLDSQARAALVSAPVTDLLPSAPTAFTAPGTLCPMAGLAQGPPDWESGVASQDVSVLHILESYSASRNYVP